MAEAGKRVICRSHEVIECGKGVRFKLARHGIEETAFVVRFQGTIHAYVNRCAHVSTELDWIEGEFFDSDGRFIVCSTHGALYAPESGRCVLGRCNGKGLEQVAVAETDGLVLLME